MYSFPLIYLFAISCPIAAISEYFRLLIVLFRSYWEITTYM